MASSHIQPLDMSYTARHAVTFLAVSLTVLLIFGLCLTIGVSKWSGMSSKVSVCVLFKLTEGHTISVCVDLMSKSQTRMAAHTTRVVK